MKTKHLLSNVILLAALLLAGCGAKVTAPLAVPEGAQAGDLTGLSDCEFRLGNSKTKYDAECGTLVAPENWEEPDSRLIALPIVRIPAAGPEEAEPVFYLQGGPGDSNLSWEPPAWILKNHDVVMVGYRGADGSVVLSCPGVTRMLNAHKGKDLLSEQARAEYTSAVEQCAETHQKAGVDLSGYTIPAVVEDLEAARVALGYERVNLFGESYGTRVAQIYAYLYPQALHRLVLVGVNTPGRFIWNPADFDRMIEHISGLCAQDAACSSRTSDFARTMYGVNRDMPGRWLFFRIDPDTVRYAAHMFFFSNTTMPMVFDAYLAAGEGDPSGLAMLNLIVSLFPFDPVWGDQFSKGKSVDMEKYGGLESVSLGDTIMGAPLSEWVWYVAQDWPIDLIRKDLRELQETDVEMLLVNGSVDFSTPPSALNEAGPYFHRAQTVTLPEFSHTGDVTHQQPEAFERLITTYYDNGVADDSLYVYQPLSFRPDMSLPLVAKLLVAAVIVLSVLLIWGVISVVRRGHRNTNP